MTPGLVTIKSEDAFEGVDSLSEWTLRARCHEESCEPGTLVVVYEDFVRKRQKEIKRRRTVAGQSRARKRGEALGRPEDGRRVEKSEGGSITTCRPA